MLVKSPVAEVRVLPKPGNSAAKGNLMSVSRVHDDADALVWPRMCCCCCRATDLDAIGIYSRAKFGNIHALIHIPYCRKLHYRRASGKALESAAEVFGIGLAILSVAFFAGILIDSIVAFILQVASPHRRRRLGRTHLLCCTCRNREGNHTRVFGRSESRGDLLDCTAQWLAIPLLQSGLRRTVCSGESRRLPGDVVS
jgi:hypothetical protein